MVMKSSRYFLLGFLFIAGILFSLNFVVADFTDCWNKTGDETACGLDSNCKWTTNATDDWCYDSVGCCMDIGCWDFDGTDETTCTNTSSNGGLNCTWDPYAVDTWKNTTGMCFDEWSLDRKSTRLNSSHIPLSRMPSSA